MAISGLFVALVVAVAAPRDPFLVQVDLQSLYDEDSAAELQFDTTADIDRFHEVFCTADWIFIDADGSRHLWEDVRDRAASLLTTPRFDSIEQPIQKLALTPSGATVVVAMTTLRAVVDSEGRFGRAGVTHTVAETTTFRDTWAETANGWRQTSRQQIGAVKRVTGQPPDDYQEVWKF